MKGTVQYNQAVRERKREQSYLLLSEEEAQQYVFKLCGTGETGALNKEKVRGIEFVNADKIIGKYFEDGVSKDTKRLQIVYSKYGVHIFPVKEYIKNR